MIKCTHTHRSRLYISEKKKGTKVLHLNINGLLNKLDHMQILAQEIKFDILGDPRKYSCLIKCKMHNKREIFKIEAVLNYE